MCPHLSGPGQIGHVKLWNVNVQAFVAPQKAQVRLTTSQWQQLQGVLSWAAPQKQLLELNLASRRLSAPVLSPVLYHPKELAGRNLAAGGAPCGQIQA